MCNNCIFISFNTDMKLTKSLLLLFILGFFGCVKPEDPVTTCSTDNLLDSFTTQDGLEVFIYENGELYIQEEANCVFETLYFNPSQLANSYKFSSTDTLLIAGSTLFPVKNNYLEDFESGTSINDLFVASVSDTGLYWTSFTLQSPEVLTVDDYVTLRKCILNGSCTFKDNKIEFSEDPVDATNRVFKFSSVAPTEEMVTAKASISSQLNYFTQTSEVWFQADYYIESGMPFSLVDFESGYFAQSPGPRVVIKNGKLAMENKFGAKILHENTTNTTVPTNNWFTIKVHIKYNSKDTGLIELWQDGEELISTSGISLPLSNAIQDILEVGVTATPEGCVLYMDNIRISENPF